MRQAFVTTIAFGIALTALWTTPVAGAAELAGSEWRPTMIGETPWAGTDAFVRFEGEGRLAGHSGCNGFFGTFELDGAGIAIGPLASTRKACPEPIMSRETLLLDALGAAHGFERDRTQLTLTDATGAPVASFVQTDWD